MSHSSLRRMGQAICCCIAPLMVCVFGMGVSEATTFYVDQAAGNNQNHGQSPEQAFASIQRAANAVQPGDTVIVAEGVYFETIRITTAGTTDQPITFRAANRALGSVIITGADRAIRQRQTPWTLEDETLGLYSVPLDHAPARVLYSNTDLLPYTTLDGLKNFIMPNHAPGARHGFAYDKQAQKLYVRLHPSREYGSTNPADHIMAVGGEGGVGFAGNGINKDAHFNLGVVTDEPAHVIIDGFTFETPGVAGVYVRGSDVTVQHCWFRGCRTGVSGQTQSSDASQTTNNITVAYCDYSQYPAFDDVVELLQTYRPDGQPLPNNAPRIFWWNRKGSGVGTHNTYETGIINLVGTNWQVHHNHIHDAFEGMSCWAIRWSDRLEVHDNVFARLVDNAVEAEDHAKNLYVYDNVIRNTFEPFSWQPLGGEPWPGPVYIYRNIIDNDPQLMRLWRNAGHTPGWFKAGAPGKNWNREHMQGVPKDVVRPPGDGVVVFNNTVFYPYGDFMTRVQPMERAFENFHFVNNICHASGFANGDAFEGSRIQFVSNLWVGNGSEPDARGQIFAGEDGQVLPDVAALRLKDPAQGEFAPQAGSPAIDAAKILPVTVSLPRLDQPLTDIGAVPHEQPTPSPKVGPLMQPVPFQPLAIEPLPTTSMTISLSEKPTPNMQGLKLNTSNASLKTVPGPYLNTTGMTADTTQNITATRPQPASEQGTLSLWIRLDETVQSGEEADELSAPILEWPGVAKLSLEGNPSAATIRWMWADHPFDARNMVTHVPGLPGPGWYHLAYVWDANAGISQGYLNGTPLRLPGTRIDPWQMQSNETELSLHVGPLAIGPISVYDTALTAEQIREQVPTFYQDSMATMLGQRELGPLEVQPGKLLYANPLDSQDDVANWRMEGPGKVSFDDGVMLMQSQRPDGPRGHVVFWIDRDFPKNFVARWQVQPVDAEGLCIVFFAATGHEGKDLFDPSLPERKGLFPRYVKGQINCYHISYYANAPDAPGRITVNMRKNAGFYLVANGPPGIKPGSADWHEVTLVKNKGHVELAIDGQKVIDFFDNGQTYGPVLGSGKIGLRQMQWTRMRYRNLRIYAMDTGQGDQTQQ